MRRALVAGSVVLDIVPVFPSGMQVSLGEGKQIDLDGIRYFAGGCVGNTGIAMSKLGISVRLIGKTGNDEASGIIRSILEASGAEVSLAVCDHVPTTTSIVISLPGHDRSILHRRGAGQTFSSSDIRDSDLKDISLFHFGYPPTMRQLWSDSGKGLTDMLSRIKGKHIATSLDMCMASGLGYSSEECKIALSNALPYTDFILPSIEETLFMLMPLEYRRLISASGEKNPIDSLDIGLLPEVADMLIGMGAGVVCLKIGKKGLYLRTAGKKRLMNIGGDIFDSDAVVKWSNRELLMPPCFVDDIVSTTGAGDTAIAGFLAAVMNGFGPEESLEAASVTASMCIGSDSRAFGVPVLDSVVERMRKGYRQEAIDADLSHWKYAGRYFIGADDRGRFSEPEINERSDYVYNYK